MKLHDLPTLNAVLNATSALLLLVGYLLIRAGRREAHRKVMLLALACSALFLTSYLVYHFQVGSVRFRGEGPVRTLTHTVLAVAIVPLVLVTLSRALRGRFELHRRLARLTLPLWAYVSVTGVVVYWMLYRL